ncbi:MAG: segregation/condensation protein A [Thermoplasmata archaeon]|nr:segregation/condensation protein A [Thermoplasmata archaeon]
MRLLDDIVRHLIIHEAMLDEEDGSVHRYREILQETTEGRYLSITDPVDRTISLVFSLVLENQLDPWDIDLIQFCRLYLEKVRQEEIVDLVSGGRILLMAWNILKLQTEDALARAAPPEIDHDTDDWTMEVDLFAHEVDFEYTMNVKKGRDPPIHPRVFRKGERPVTLVELIDAFTEATEEAQRHVKAFESRRARMAKLQQMRERSVRKMIHKEDLVEDIGRVWTRICALNGEPIPITDLTAEDDYILVFMAILFLSNDGKIKILQKDFPYGMIYVKNLKVGEAKPQEKGAAEA